MEINPLDQVDAADESRAEVRKSRLNTRVALTVALLATFTGVCKVKDDNIVQAMQQAQADRVDDWNYYQAKNVREEIARATADELRAEEVALPRDRLDGMLVSVARYDSLATNEAEKKEQVRRHGEEA